MNTENRQRLLTYIVSQKKRGVSDDNIKKALLGVGWKEGDVDLCFSEVNDISYLTEADVTQPSLHQSEKDLSEKPEQIQEKDLQEEEEQVDWTRSVVGVENGGDGSFMKTVLVVSAFVVVLGGASVAAYFALQSSDQNKLVGERGLTGKEFEKLSNEEVLVKAVLANLKASSFRNSTKLNLSVGDFLEADLAIDGSFKISEKTEDAMTEMTLTLDLVFREGGLTMEIPAEVEIRSIAGEIYIRINKGPEIPFVGDLSLIEGEWLIYTGSDEINQSIDVGVPLESKEELLAFIEEHGVRFLEIGQKTEALNISILSEENNIKTYLIEMNIGKMHEFARDLAEEPFLSERKDDILKAADEMEEEWLAMKDDMGIDDEYLLPLELSVDKQSLYISRLFLTFLDTFDGGFVKDFFGEDVIKAELLIESVFGDIDKGFAVERPNADRTLEEALDELFENMFGDVFSLTEPVPEGVGALLDEDEDGHKTGGSFTIERFLRAGAIWVGGEN